MVPRIYHTIKNKSVYQNQWYQVLYILVSERIRENQEALHRPGTTSFTVPGRPELDWTGDSRADMTWLSPSNWEKM